MKKKENIEPRNEYGQKHGLCIYYTANGNVWIKQRWVNGKKHGITERYFNNGKLWSKEYWLNGECVYGEWYVIRYGIKFKI